MISTKMKQEIRSINAIGLILFTLLLSFLGGMIVSSSWNTEAFTVGDVLTVLSGAILSLVILVFSAIAAKRWNAPIWMLLVIIFCVAGGTCAGYILVEIPTEIIVEVAVGSYLLVIFFMVTCYLIEYYRKKYLGDVALYP